MHHFKFQPEFKQGLSSKAQQRIAERAGYSIVKLHSVWERSLGGDAAAEKEIQSLLVRYHEVSKLLDGFQRAAKRHNSHSKAHAALTKAVIFKSPESPWVRAKSKWLQIGPGGLPTLGKRR